MRLQYAAAKPLFGKPSRNRTHAFHFVAIASQSGFIRDAFEFRQVVGEPTFLIRPPEKLSVRQARSEDPLMARSHQSFGIFRQIDNRQKVWCYLSISSFDRKVFLVTTHHGDQDLVG